MDSGLRRKDEKEKYDKLPHNLAMQLLTESGANALIAQRLTGQSPILQLITFTYSLRSKRPFLTLKG